MPHACLPCPHATHLWPPPSLRRYTADHLLLGGHLEGYTDVVLCPTRISTAQFANLPRLESWMLTEPQEVILRHVQDRHNCCIVPPGTDTTMNDV